MAKTYLIISYFGKFTKHEIMYNISDILTLKTLYQILLTISCWALHIWVVVFLVELWSLLSRFEISLYSLFLFNKRSFYLKSHQILLSMLLVATCYVTSSFRLIRTSHFIRFQILYCVIFILSNALTLQQQKNKDIFTVSKWKILIKKIKI